MRSVRRFSPWLALLVCGCAMGSGQTVWLGPIRAAPRVSFADTQRALVEHDYPPIVVDEVRGELVVEAHAGGGHTFRIAFHQGGWIRIEPAGPRVEHATLWRMPEGLRREYYRLSEMIERHAQIGGAR